MTDDDEDEHLHAGDVTDPVTRRVRLLSRPCDTCVIFPDNRAHLRPGRREQFIADAVANDGYIVCHATIGHDAPRAICRGFWNVHRKDTLPLRLVACFGLAVEVDPPTHA